MNKILILVNITGLIIGVSYGLHGPILPIFAKNIIGASYTNLGLIGIASFLPYMFIPLFVGVLLDRFNNGFLLALGSVINAVSIYLLSVANTVPEIMIFRIMTGIAHAFFWPPCESIISRYSSDKNRVRNISWFTMFFVTGFMIGPLFGTILLEQADATYRVLFQVTALVLATTMISALMASRNGIRYGHKRLDIASIKEMKKFPEVIVLVIFYTTSFGVILSIYPAFLDDSGLSDTDVLLLYFVFGVARVGTLALGGSLARRTSSTLIAATAAISAGLAISVVADSIVMFAIALLLMGFGFSIFFPLTLEIVLRRTKRAISGKIIGAYETVFGMGMVIGPTLGGLTTEWFGVKAPYMILGIIGVGIMILAIISRKRLESGRFVTE